MEAFAKAKGYELQHAGPKRYYLYELKRGRVPSGATFRRAVQNPKTSLATFSSLQAIHAFSVGKVGLAAESGTVDKFVCSDGASEPCAGECENGAPDAPL